MNESIDWKKTTLGSISLVNGQYGANEAAVSLKERNARYIRITDIDDDGQLMNEGAVGSNIEKIEQYTVNYSDLLFARTGATTGKCYLHRAKTGTYTFAGFLIRFKIDESKADPYFIWLMTKTKKYDDWVKTMSARSGQPGINSKEYSNLEIMVPPLSIQKKITQILSTWDDAINKTLTSIQNEKRRKKSILSKIYRGQLSEKHSTKVDFKRLKQYLSEVTSRKNESINNVLSVSNSKGFIPQDEQFEREVASKDRSNYKVVRRGEFAYNPSRVNVGSIDLLTTQESGILSPMYVVFKCNDELNNRYLYHFLKSDLFLQMIPKYTQGSVRDSLAFDGLCSMKLYIPIIEEQLAYSQALDAIDDYIKKHEKLLELYRLQKQGLMQQLFTGKIRVNVN